MKTRSLLLCLAAMACARVVPETGAGAPVRSPASRLALAGVSDHALRVYREAWVVDTHIDLPERMLDGYDADVRHAPGASGVRGHTDFPRLVESGVRAVFLAAWVDAPYAARHPDASFARANEGIDTIRAFVGRHPEKLRLVTTADGVRDARAAGQVAVLIGVEGGHAIEDSLEKLRALHARGARYLTLTWNNGNSWAGSSIGSAGTRTGGLTEFGREVIREMNRLGMLVDVSHVSEQTLADAVAASSAPVIASHSSARALADHPRNLTDAQLVAIAKTGGVVNVNFYSRFIDPAFLAAFTAMEAALDATLAADLARPGADSAALRATHDRERMRRIEALPRTPLSVLIDHIDHVARVAGIEHVGIGSDFDGVTAVPAGMEDITYLPRLAQALLDRGYSDADVARILGGNMMRVMDQVLVK